ncbi:hypothetical protein EVAR_81990_1 [Eumeta japonica]|uniref:Uncharacterized protein n=1 Tax=Eumeta variegata TaxID=151549 RepID=A0A4C1VVF9_EUMVA|nr:hypothetical protein EVAR_81990_1 [Eumeta japonica]
MAPQIKIKVLKNLQRFENVSLVFRNQLFSFKSWWAFASFSLTLEIVLSVNALGKYFDLGVAWSAEIFITLGAIVIFFVLMAYVAITYEDWTTFAFATFFILLYGAITIVLAATSQKVIKSLDAAYVMMTRINFTLVAGDKHSRYVKSLLRVSALRSRGGGLRCSGGLRLGMPLVPAMLSVSAAYTIVVMQFSNAVWNLRL